MTPRTAAALAAVLVAAGAPQALAAPKTACRQVLDGAGDAEVARGVPSAALDILSADLATGRKNLVAILRLASVTPDSANAGGAGYHFTWRAGTVEQGVNVIEYAGGRRHADFDPNTAVTGDEIEMPLVVDTVTKSFVWTLPRKANPVLAKKGTRFSGLAVRTTPGAFLSGREAGADFSMAIENGVADEAFSGKTYTDGAPTCVKGV